MTIKHRYPVLIFALLSLLLTASPVWCRNVLPSPHPLSLLTDLSGTLKQEYLAQLENQLQEYPFEVRVLYLPETHHINLAFYAEKVFRHWHMSSESVLLVVALDRRKIGIYVGSALRKQLKQLPPPGKELDVSSPESVKKLSQPTIKDDYLNMLPYLIADLAQVQRIQKSQPQPSLNPSKQEEALLETSHQSGQNLERPRLTWAQMLPLYIFLALLLLTGLLILSVRLWQKRKAYQELVAKYLLEGQATYNEIERLYALMDHLLPEFHTYQGDTKENLNLFLKEVYQLQDQYDEIFDQYEEQVHLLSTHPPQSEAIDFFENLDASRTHGQALLKQAQSILHNLKELKEKNQQQLEQLQHERKHVSQALYELKKLHPHLKLNHFSTLFQQHYDTLRALEEMNARDPMQVEKRIQLWLKALRKMERELQSLPHLWLQFNQELRSRIEDLKARATQKIISPAQAQQLAEVQRLHQKLLQAIEQGDLEKMSHLNSRFTTTLQNLESQI